MASGSINQSQLCERCASWDLDHLFKGDVDDAYQVGPLRDQRYRRTWDRVPLDSVGGNMNCPLCQFIYQLVITSSAWTEISQNSLKFSNQFYLNYQKEEFCSLNDRVNGTKEEFTTLTLKLQDNWDPEKSSPGFSYLNYPSLQCYMFRPYKKGQNFQQMLAVRRIGSQIDFDLVQHWIKSCNAHGEACSKQIKVGQRVSSRIRLVDVKRKRLVWMTTSETYAVLSYMWGPPSLEQARLTRSTHAGLFLDGALAYDNDTIPRTIRDAMAVCERLGIPNLWVDALCIEQDSSDFNVHLHMMNDIYAAAYLTIVTACGAESWNGLSGVRPGSREVYQPSIIIDDMEIGLAVQEFWTSVMHSPWANRGWTFQERLFSRRMLIFADTQCFFYCDKLSRFESTITEVDEEDMRIEHRFLYPHLWVDDRRKLFISKNMRLNSVQLDYLKDSLLDYFQLFRNHRRLSLTYQADVLRAFWGVTATYEQRMSSAFYFGMPLSLFTLALLLGCTQCTRRPSFPSWCWAGWSADREELRYPNWVAYNSYTVTIFYRLHPTLNSGNKQEQWILEAIDDRETKGAADTHRGIDPVLFHQHPPKHLNRQDLEQILVFDTLVSKNKIYARALAYFRNCPYAPDLDGEGFDREHNMTFASILLGELEYLYYPSSSILRDLYSPNSNVSASTLFPPYISWSTFGKDASGEPIPKSLELILIAKGRYNREAIVWLMVVDTD